VCTLKNTKGNQENPVIKEILMPKAQLKNPMNPKINKILMP